MSEASRLREIISRLRNTVSIIDKEYTREVAYTAILAAVHSSELDARDIPHDCPQCGDAMTRLKSNWKCQGCGKVVEL